MDDRKTKIYSNLRALLKEDNQSGHESKKKSSLLEKKCDEFGEWAASQFGNDEVKNEIRKILEPLIAGSYHGSLLQVTCRLQRINVRKFGFLFKKGFLWFNFWRFFKEFQTFQR